MEAENVAVAVLIGDPWSLATIMTLGLFSSSQSNFDWVVINPVLSSMLNQSENVDEPILQEKSLNYLLKYD